MSNSHRGDDVHSVEAAITVSIRDRIADIIWDNRQTNDVDPDYVADAILAALPELTASLSTARNDALQEAMVAVKEPIAKIVYDSWYKNDWPVGSHGYQRVQEACEAAIIALKTTPPAGETT